jgi:tetratricopeptide (TPR) repeat protein
MRSPARRRLDSVRRRWLGRALAVGIGAGLGPHAAAASEPEGAGQDPRGADAAYQEAEAAYQRGQWLEAAEALERAYALDPRPTFLYRRGHALREAGSCRAAIGSFEAFLAVANEPADREEAQGWIDHCRRVLASEPSPEDETETEPQPSTEPEPEPATSPPRVDPWGAAGVGAGAGLVVLGGALFGASHAVASGGPATQTETEYLARERRTAALSISGIVSMSVGGAALLAGAIRLGVLASRRRGATRSSEARRDMGRVAIAIDGVVVRF